MSEKIKAIAFDPKVRTGVQDTVFHLLESIELDPIEDLAGGATLAATVTKVNELLAALRAVGLLAE